MRTLFASSAALLLPLLLLGQPALAPNAFAKDKPAKGVHQEGEASYYRGGQSGHSKTTTGEPVDPNSNAAASRDLPPGTEATVTNKNTGQSTDVRVNDRGPERKDRVIDLSKKSAGDIGMEKTGKAPVTVQADPAKQKDPKVRRQVEQMGERSGNETGAPGQ
ncbi:septal ring lytic transglycosylase RlpA family protein [Azospirillum sp. sgz302134]